MRAIAGHGFKVEVCLLSRAHLPAMTGPAPALRHTPERAHPSPLMCEGPRVQTAAGSEVGPRQICSCGKSIFLAGHLAEEKGLVHGPSSRTRRKCLRKVHGIAIWLGKPQGLYGLLSPGSLVKLFHIEHKPPQHTPPSQPVGDGRSP